MICLVRTVGFHSYVRLPEGTLKHGSFMGITYFGCMIEAKHMGALTKHTHIYIYMHIHICTL